MRSISIVLLRLREGKFCDRTLFSPSDRSCFPFFPLWFFFYFIFASVHRFRAVWCGVRKKLEMSVFNPFPKFFPPRIEAARFSLFCVGTLPPSSGRRRHRYVCARSEVVNAAHSRCVSRKGAWVRTPSDANFGNNQGTGITTAVWQTSNLRIRVQLPAGAFF